MSKKTKKILVGAALTLIVLWGGLLRFWGLGSQSLWVDEAYTVNAAQDILAHGCPVMATGKIYTQGYLTNYLVAGMMKIVPFDPYDPWQTRVPAALFGTLAIITLFFLVKEVLGDEFIALLSSAILAFSYWEIAWSRQARGYSIATFFILMSLLYLWKFVKKTIDAHKGMRKIHWKEWSTVGDAVWAGGFFVLAVLSQNVAFVFFPVFVGVFGAVIFLSLRPHNSLNKALVFFYAVMVSSLAAFLCASALSVHLGGSQLFFLARLWQIMPIFIIGGLLGTLVPLLADIVKKKDILPLTFLVIFWYVPVIFSLFYIVLPRERYVFLAFPILIVLGVLGISKIIAYLFEKKLFSYVRYMLILAIVIFVTFSSLSFAPKSSYFVGDEAQPDLSAVLMYIQNNILPGDTIISYDAAIPKVYLNDPGTQLSVGEIAEWGITQTDNKNNIDVYTGAPVISSYSEFQNILNTKHGFFFIDKASQSLLGGSMYIVENSSNTQFVFGTQGSDPVSVYKF